MPETQPLTVDFPPDARDTFAERRGGWILSLCLHVMLFSALVIYKPRPTVFPATPPPAPIRVMLAEEPAAALAPVTNPLALGAVRMPALAAAVEVLSIGQAPVVPPAPVAAGSSLISQGISQGQAAGAGHSLAAGGGAPGKLGPPRKAAPAETARDVDALFPSSPNHSHPFQGDDGGGGGETPGGPGEGLGSGGGGGKGSPAIAGRIQAAQAGVMAQKTLYSKPDVFAARGAAEGVLRDLDTGGVPQDKAKEVLDRYGIKILVTKVNGSGGDKALLNRDNAGGGRFVNKFSSGVFCAFSYGSAAVGRMAQLEEEALRAGGFDPTKSRVVSVMFGIVSTTAGYDLGVKKIDVIPLVSSPKVSAAEESAAGPPEVSRVDERIRREKKGLAGQPEP